MSKLIKKPSKIKANSETSRFFIWLILLFSIAIIFAVIYGTISSYSETKELGFGIFFSEYVFWIILIGGLFTFISYFNFKKKGDK